MKRVITRTGLYWVAPLLLVLIFGACSDDNTSPGDTTAPAAISNLAAGSATTSSLVLTWTSPGDDGNTGTATSYDIRYSTATITAANFAAAQQVSGEPAPAAAGTSQTVTVSGLSPNTPYFFAMKASDEEPNVSALSNVAQGQTLPGGAGDTAAPAAITTLATGTVTTTSVVLTWTAVGDDSLSGTAAQYDIRYSTTAITAASFAAAQQLSGEPTPGAAGAAQTMTASGLSANTPYHFAIKVADEVPNWSDLSNVVQATTATTGDTTPPAAITTLATGTVTTNSVVLTWTAVGDDSLSGTAGQYDIRYSTTAITVANFAAAQQVSGEPTPAAAGASQTMTVTGLSPNTPYHFAIKTGDEVPNWSGLSNVAQATTTALDTTPPSAITTLAAVALDSTSVQLTWTATGDDGSTGTAAQYDIRYSRATITEANWASATAATGEPVPALAGTTQVLTVASLQPDTDYYFAMKTADEVPNVSGLSTVALVHTPAAQTAPPGLVIPDFPDTVCISSTDQYAQVAKGYAQMQLALVNAYAGLAAAFLGPLASADWQGSGDCWDYAYDIQGCSWQYRVCRSGSEYAYTLTLNGSCTGQVYNNWVAYRTVTNLDTRTGTFYIYQLNTSIVEVAWVWTWAADENSGTYTFYQGDPASSPATSNVVWSRSADRNIFDMTYTVTDELKWESHYEKTPCSGWGKNYQWDSNDSQWWKDTDIAWYADGTGYYDIYDDSGQREEHHVW